MERWPQFQTKLLERIIKQIDAEDPLLHLAEQMGLSRNTLYKRYAGYTPFHLEELLFLTKKYNLSVDGLVHDSEDWYQFYFPFSRNSKPDPVAFLSNIARDLNFLIKSGNPSVWYVSDEIPFFQYMHFDLLFAFKLCVWGRLIWSDDNEMEAVSPLELMHALQQHTKLRDMREHLLQMYLTIPTVEIWSTHVVDNTVEQIKYLVFTGQLQDRGMLEDIIQDLEQLNEHMLYQAGIGEKRSVGNRTSAHSSLALFHNEMTHTNNTILTRCDAGRTIYLTYDNPNYMKCEDEPLCQYTEDWMKNLQRQTVLISKSAEKHRVRYFAVIREKIQALRKELL
jgi:hypothetical protein